MTKAAVTRHFKAEQAGQEPQTLHFVEKNPNKQQAVDEYIEELKAKLGDKGS